MSRSSGVSKTLQVPPDCHVEVKAVLPSGDCFYDAMLYMLPSSSVAACGKDKDIFSSAQTMREHVASKLTTESFELYRMYGDAGVEDYSWMRHHRYVHAYSLCHARALPIYNWYNVVHPTCRLNRLNPCNARPD